MTNALQRGVSVALAVVFGFAALAQAQTFTTLYNFTGGSDGGNPLAGVIQDSSGNLYGTTASGGSYYYGVVFKLDTAGTETVLHSFSQYPDGADPYAPVVRDSKGNTYGTTWSGGSHNVGTVFKINSAGKEKVLYSFDAESDGCQPWLGLVRDKAGNLFGTTEDCGSWGYGTIFKVDSAGKFSVLHSFAGAPSDGANPQLGHLTMDKSGDLYGVTVYGGYYGYGALYKLSKNGTLTLLHSFKGGSDGCNPEGSVLQDKDGNLYGTTKYCGNYNTVCTVYGCGTIWKVSKEGKTTILHRFAGGASDGCYPYAGVSLDSKGNLYGVTAYCGTSDYGTLYELKASGRLTLLHSFDNSDGAYPWGEVLRTCKGTLFGTAYGSSTGCYPWGCGTVWEYVP